MTEDMNNVHILDELPIEEIKRIILKHIEKHDSFWPDELADDLNLDPFDVIEACEKLVHEERLKVLTEHGRSCE